MRDTAFSDSPERCVSEALRSLLKFIFERLLIVDSQYQTEVNQRGPTVATIEENNQRVVPTVMEPEQQQVEP